jgi:hypothetical protein
MLQPKARRPCWFGDQLRSRSSLLSWRRPRPRSSWWHERLSRLLSTLSARRRASMVFRASWLGPRRLLTADAEALTPSPRSHCCEGGGFEPWADGAPARPCSERWREAEFFACWAAAASSSAFTCWCTHRSSVAGSGQPRSSVGLRPVCRRRRCAAVWLVCSWAALAPVAIPLVGLPLHRNVLHWASIAVPLSGLPLHRYALRRL